MRTERRTSPQRRVESGQPLEAADAVVIITDLAEQLADLHEQGRLHLSISVKSLTWDDTSSRCRLQEPAERSLVTDDPDRDDLRPPELQSIPELELPSDLTAARKRLLESSIDVKPERIDVFQLGALFSRLLTGRTLAEYLQSPRVRGLTPVPIRSVIDSALGYDPEHRFGSVPEILVALRELDGESQTAQFSGDPGMLGSTPASAASSTAASRDTDMSGAAIPAGDTDVDGLPESRAVETSSLPFNHLGHFDITECIGHGGMGDVYRGYDSSLDREVAIKVLPAELARHPDLVARFHAEAAAVAKLSHSNVVQIHYIGEDRGHHFFAMQFVDGESLAELLARRGKLPVDEALAVCEQALCGLEAAHQRGLIHRDVKPGNILLDRQDRRVLLADFGLVKFAEGAATGTATGVIMGTVDYISPEQGRGSGTIDARTDLYSMGVVLFQMLSGELPFHADSPTALIFQHVYEAAPRLDETTSSAPAELARIVARLLEKSPDDRYGSAADVLADLRAYREGRSLPSEQVPLVASAADRAQGTQILQAPAFDSAPILPAGLMEGATMREAGLLDWAKARFRSLYHRHAPEFVRNLQNTQQQIDGGIYQYERRQRELEQLVMEAEEVAGELDRQAAEWSAAATEAEQNLASAPTEEATTAARRDQSHCRQQAEEVAAQADAQREQLDVMRLRLDKVNATLQQLISQRDLLNARLDTARARIGAGKTAAWKHRRRWVVGGVCAVAAIPAAWIAVWSYLTRTDDRPHPLPEPTTSRDADSSGPTLLQFTGHTANVMSVAFSPDGKYVASGGLDNTARVWNIDTGEQVQSFDGHSNVVQSVRFSPDGKQLLTASGGQLAGNQIELGEDNTLRLWDLETGRELQRFEGHTHWVKAARFNPDGDRILSGDRNANAKLWDSATGDELSWPVQPKACVSDLALSADAQLAVLGTWWPDDPLQLYEVSSGRKIERFPPQPGSVQCLAVSPDGNYLVVGYHTSETLRMFDFHSGELLREFVGHEGRPMSISFGRDSRQFLSSAIDGTVRLWETSTGRELRRIDVIPGGGMVPEVAFSPDGDMCVATALTNVSLYQLPGFKSTAPMPSVASVPSVDVSNPLDPMELPDRISLLRELTGHSGAVLAVAFSPDGRYVATGGVDATPRLWNAETGEEVRRFYGHSDAVRCLDFSPDGTRLLTGAGGSTVLSTTSRQHDGSARIWNVETGEELTRFSAHVGAVLTARFDPTGRVVLSGCATSTARLWDAETGVELYWLGEPLSPVSDVAFTFDGRFAAIASHRANDPLDFCSVARRTEIERFDVPLGRIHCLGISPDGQRLVLGYLDPPTLLVYDVETGEEVARCEGHSAHPTAISFHRDGRHFVSSSADGTVRLWETETGHEVTRIPIHRDGEDVLDVAISPDGDRCAVTSFSNANLYSLPALSDPIAASASTVPVEHSEPFHGIEFPDDYEISRLEIGAWKAGGSSRQEILTVPPSLAGRMFTWRGGDGASVSFRVNEDRNVLLAMCDDWGGGGRGGPWQNEIISREEFEAEGWREVVRLNLVRSPAQPGFPPLGYTVFVRACRAGEEFEIKNHKYNGPFLISGDVAPAPTATEDGSAILGVEVGRNPEPVDAAEFEAAMATARAQFDLRRSGSAEFSNALRSVAANLHEAPVTIDDEPVQWDVWRALDTGSREHRLSAFRFISLLREPADMHWVFASARPMGNWYILPVTGRMSGFRRYSQRANLDINGVDLPPGNRVFFQSLTGGQIQPGGEYIVWFALPEHAAEEITLAIRLTPAGEPLGSDSVEAVSSALGLDFDYQEYEPTDEGVRQAFEAARELMIDGNVDEPLCRALWSVADRLPKINVTGPDDGAVWNKNSTGEAAVNAFRFRSPLEVLADLHWAFTLQDQVQSWTIISDDMQRAPLADYYVAVDVDVPRAAADDPVFLQAVHGGFFEPDREYIALFVSEEEAELNLSLRLTPSGTHPDDDSLNAIADVIGIDVPESPSSAQVQSAFACCRRFIDASYGDGLGVQRLLEWVRPTLPELVLGDDSPHWNELRLTGSESGFYAFRVTAPFNESVAISYAVAKPDEPKAHWTLFPVGAVGTPHRVQFVETNVVLSGVSTLSPLNTVVYETVINSEEVIGKESILWLAPVDRAELTVNVAVRAHETLETTPQRAGDVAELLGIE